MALPIVIGNWKMHTSIPEALDLVRRIKEPLSSISLVQKVVCPPFISLAAVSETLSGSSIHVGAQNMHWENAGAYTGEISPDMLLGLCDFVILGHSERRQHFGEDNQSVKQKVNAAIRHNLRPVICIGETLVEREMLQVEEVLTNQLLTALEGVLDPSPLVIAYEPIWAIGTGRSADPEMAQSVMGTVQKALIDRFGKDSAVDIPLVYGGSVTAENIAGFVGQPNIHGTLVGGASLKPDQFIDIVRIIANIRKTC